MSRKISRGGREVLRAMLARKEPYQLDEDKALELKRRGLISHRSTSISVRPDGANTISKYQLTPRGIQVAEQVTRNAIGHGLCWRV